MSNQDDVKREIVDIAGELDQRGLRDEADAMTELLARVVGGDGMSREAQYRGGVGPQDNTGLPSLMDPTGGMLSEEAWKARVRTDPQLRKMMHQQYAQPGQAWWKGELDNAYRDALRQSAEGGERSVTIPAGAVSGMGMPGVGMGGYGMPGIGMGTPMGGVGMGMPMGRVTPMGGGMGMPIGGAAAGGASPLDLTSLATMPPEQIQTQIERLNRQIQMLQAALPKAQANAVEGGSGATATPAAAGMVGTPVATPSAGTPAAPPPATVQLKQLQDQYMATKAQFDASVDPARRAELNRQMQTIHGYAEILRQQNPSLPANRPGAGVGGGPTPVARAAAIANDLDEMMKLANRLDDLGKFEEADRVTAAAHQAAMRRAAQNRNPNDPGLGERADAWMARQRAGLGQAYQGAQRAVGEAVQGLGQMGQEAVRGGQQAIQQGQRAVGETVQGLGQMGQEAYQAVEQRAQQAGRAAQEAARAAGRTAQEIQRAGEEAYQRAKQQARALPGQAVNRVQEGVGMGVGAVQGLMQDPDFQRGQQRMRGGGQSPAGGQPGGAKQYLQQGIGSLDTQLNQLRQQGVPENDPRIVRLQNTKRQMGGYVGQAGQL